MRFQLLTMRQTKQTDCFPIDTFDSWELLGWFETLTEARSAASEYIKTIKPIGWLEVADHLDIGCGTPAGLELYESDIVWFKIFGVKDN